ncbi:MAG: arginine--tRNA ligase [Proteobacteria bacterium]|nr:arginine--tRNA ligase [Pseudomonadota bacterium]
MDVSTLTIAELEAHLQARVAAALAQVGAPGVAFELVAPPQPEQGDLGFPCFALARVLRRAPPQIAREVAAALTPDAVIAAASDDKGYVNLKLHEATLVQVVLRQALSQGARFGAEGAAAPQHWLIEYSSPNTNKPLHLGHLRNNLLGAAVAALLRFVGHRVTRVNLVNDRGVHICKSMLAYQLWGAGSDPQSAGQKGDRLVGDCYVRFERRLSEEYLAWQQTPAAAARLQGWVGSGEGRVASAAQAFFAGYKDDYFNQDSVLGAQVRELLLRWEQGDPEVLALWRRMNDWVLAGFQATYARMGVGFELIQYESETYKLGKRLVQEGLDRGVMQRRADGAVICDLAQVGLSGEKVLLRSDGTSVYMTQDLGTAVERVDQLQPAVLVYVVGDEQNYHFDVLFKILGLLRPGLAERCRHLSYGMIRLPEGRMKSREGTVVDADDLMDEMHRLARAETEARVAEGKAHTADLSEAELERRAEHIGMAALKYFLLKYSPRSAFEYDPRASIDFLGQTGPYCLFNYARTRSLVRKVGGGEPGFEAAAAARLQTPQELDLVRRLAQWPALVLRAAESCDPSRLAEYLFDLCKRFAFIFTDKANHPIATCDDAELRAARLMLVAAVGHTVKAGLGLLGIAVLEEM